MSCIRLAKNACQTNKSGLISLSICQRCLVSMNIILHPRTVALGLKPCTHCSVQHTFQRAANVAACSTHRSVPRDLRRRVQI